MAISETPIYSAIRRTLCSPVDAPESMYYEPLKKIRVDTVRRSEARTVESQ